MKCKLAFLSFALVISACSGDVSAVDLPLELPAPTLPATLVPSPTPKPDYLKMTVWVEEPRVPMLAYHQLAPDTSEYSTGHKVRVSDLRNQLEDLYLAGFTLVSVEDWIGGDISVPFGRKPLIISMDDLFFNNQIALDEDGIPTKDTAIGVIWQFAQDHPQFGFHLALFASLGDKLYAEPDYPDWEEKLARAIAWCLDHGAMVYNHTYQHVRLDRTDPLGVKSELRRNDLYLRELLALVGRQDLIPKLGNMLALPYGYWPDANGAHVIKNYATPEDVLMQAVFLIDNNERAGFVPPPYSPKFDRFKIPRIAARPVTIQYLLDHEGDFPAADSCRLGPVDPLRLSDAGYLSEQIKLVVNSEICPVGMYAVNGWIFNAYLPAVPLVFP